jgi:glycosyltransferase involved in cell wall biosynthesis
MKTALFCYSGEEPNLQGSGMAVRYWVDLEAIKALGYEVICARFCEESISTASEIISLPMYHLLKAKNWRDYQLHRWVYPILKPREWFFPQYGSPTIQKLRGIIDKWNPDIFFFEHLRPWIVGSALQLPHPQFVCIHDFDYILNYGNNREHLGRRLNPGIWNLLAIFREYWGSKWLRRYSFNLLRRASLVFTCGRRDGDQLDKAGINSRFIPVPVGKQPKEETLTCIRKRLSNDEGKNQIVKIIHVGGLDSSHNSKGVKWFLEKCWSKLRVKTDGHAFELHFIGSLDNASEAILSHRRKQGLVFNGYVKDIESELADADFAIVPPGYATGMRTKIPEAFAYGLPVVTGRHDAYSAGLRLNDPRVLEADDPEGYANACALLIKDSTLRRKMGDIALNTWKADYDLERTTEKTAHWIKTEVEKVMKRSI